MSGPSHGQPNGVQLSVGAIRGSSDAGGLNIVSFIPSGVKIVLLRELDPAARR